MRNLSHGFRALTVLALSLVFSAASPSITLASSDWMDYCAAEEIALNRAIQDFPSDRYPESKCATQIYKRGVGEVRTKESDPDPQVVKDVTFQVKIRNHANALRYYDVQMSLDNSPESTKPCKLKDAKRVSGNW